MKRRDEVLVGLMTLITIGVLVAGMLFLARGGLARGYPLYSRFAWGAGLKQGQSVLFSGANVGYVDDVHLIEEGGIVVVMRIYKHQRVPEGAVATIQPYGYFGDQIIALKPTLGPTGKFFSPGDTIPSGPGAVQIADVIARVDTITRNLNTLMASLSTQLDKESPLRAVRLAASAADSMFKMVSRIAAEQSAQLSKTQTALLTAVNSIDSNRIAPAIALLREGVASMNTFLADLRPTTARVNGILTKLESGDGSAARLLNSPKFEEDLRAVMVRLDSLMADFKANPRKYIKFSIF